MDNEIKVVLDEKSRKGNSRHFEVHVDGEKFNINLIEKSKSVSKDKDKVKKIHPVEQHEAKNIIAPIPGTVKEYVKKEGDSVKAGETIVVLEAMKMYNSIDSKIDGVVKKITCKAGDSVMKNQILAVVE